VKEREFQGWVIDTAKRFGWRIWHVPTPMQPVAGGKFVPSSRGRGLPDLILLHPDPPRLIFAELKGDDGRLSDDQREFLRLARAVAGLAVADSNQIDGYGAPDAVRPVGVYSWRPGLEPHIETILRAKVLA
jgi:hypothetical protein